MWTFPQSFKELLKATLARWNDKLLNNDKFVCSWIPGQGLPCQFLTYCTYEKPKPTQIWQLMHTRVPSLKGTEYIEWLQLATQGIRIKKEKHLCKDLSKFKLASERHQRKWSVNHLQMPRKLHRHQEDQTSVTTTGICPHHQMEYRPQ